MMNLKYPMQLDSENSLALVSDSEDTAQAIEQHLRTFLGEWYENRSIGLPWYEYLLGLVPPDISRMNASCVSAILSVPNVAKVESLEIVTENETAKITFEASLSSGDTTGLIEVVL